MHTACRRAVPRPLTEQIAGGDKADRWPSTRVLGQCKDRQLGPPTKPIGTELADHDCEPVGGSLHRDLGDARGIAIEIEPATRSSSPFNVPVRRSGAPVATAADAGRRRH
jgi:hypothetical protein